MTYQNFLPVTPLKCRLELSKVTSHVFKTSRALLSLVVVVELVKRLPFERCQVASVWKEISHFILQPLQPLQWFAKVKLEETKSLTFANFQVNQLALKKFSNLEQIRIPSESFFIA